MPAVPDIRRIIVSHNGHIPRVFGGNCNPDPHVLQADSFETENDECVCTSTLIPNMPTLRETAAKCATHALITGLGGSSDAYLGAPLTLTEPARLGAPHNPWAAK